MIFAAVLRKVIGLVVPPSIVPVPRLIV